MFQLDDKFLEEVGLTQLPGDQKKLFLDYFREQLELRIGTQLSQGLTDAQLDEFEAFMDRNESVINTWISQNVPDYQADPIYQRLATGAPGDTPSLVLLAEYASLKWLSLNRPNYKDVVATCLADLKQETIANREAILSGSAPAE